MAFAKSFCKVGPAIVDLLLGTSIRFMKTALLSEQRPMSIGKEEESGASDNSDRTPTMC